MYDILSGIIDHAWQSNYSGDQQYLVFTCAALIIIFSVAFIDAIKNMLGAFMPRRKE